MRRHQAGGAASELARVVRGGSWNNNTVNARAAYRNNNDPGNRNNNIGFRVVRVSHIKQAFNYRDATESRFRGRIEGAVDGGGQSRPHGHALARAPSGAYNPWGAFQAA